MSLLSFKARVDPSLACFLACVQWIPEIHLWCDTCWPLGSQHGSQSRSLHACSRGRMPGFNRETSRTVSGEWVTFSDFILSKINTRLWFMLLKYHKYNFNTLSVVCSIRLLQRWGILPTLVSSCASFLTRGKNNDWTKMTRSIFQSRSSLAENKFLQEGNSYIFYWTVYLHHDNTVISIFSFSLACRLNIENLNMWQILQKY